MQTERQRRIREVFDAASGQPAQQQAEYVRRACAGDQEVEQAVLRLLQAGRKSGGFLSQPVWKRKTTALQEGTRIGAYKVIRELGSGGMGVVFLAVRADEVFRRVAAVKVMHPEFKTPSLVRRFQQEREILARLDHPNIARIVDGGTTDNGLPYFVMDYVNGQPIDVFCNRRNANLQQRLNLFRQACAAVNYLHGQRVVHRDLKPANILVTTDGVVKLLDFGIAKIWSEGADTRHTTVPLMTIGYASPEQLRGATTGPPTDIYSLGVILYELLTGLRPHDFGSKSTPEIIKLVSEVDPARPSTRVVKSPSSAISAEELRSRLKGDLDSIVLMALRKEPERRYRSAAEFAADIENSQFQRPVAARPHSFGYVASKFVQRQRNAIAAAILIVASLSFGIYEGVQRHRQERLLRNDIQRLTENYPNCANDPAGGGTCLKQDLTTFSDDFRANLPDLLGSWFVSSESREAVIGDGLTYLAYVSDQATRSPASAAALGRAYLSVASAQAGSDPQAARSTCQTALHKLGPALARFADPREASSRDARELTQVANQLGSLLRSLS